MTVGIVGRVKDTHRYEQFIHSLKINCITSLTMGELATCQALIFPGGGDITPHLYNAPNLGSRNIDTELDILQLRAFQLAYQSQIPILGICKGMQLINVGLGGTLIQDLPSTSFHAASKEDLYHETHTLSGSYLHNLYGSEFKVNSRHHQAIDKLGSKLIPVQWCPQDLCIEAFCHQTLPILGVQWHPERLNPSHTSISSLPLFQYFLSFV